LTIELRRRTLSSGRFDTPEFIAANDVFEREFLVRTPPEQRHLPLCDSTPARFNAALYEHMWGPSEVRTKRFAGPAVRLRCRDDRPARGNVRLSGKRSPRPVSLLPDRAVDLPELSCTHRIRVDQRV
jgi:hypothetical protein